MTFDLTDQIRSKERGMGPEIVARAKLVSPSGPLVPSKLFGNSTGIPMCIFFEVVT